MSLVEQLQEELLGLMPQTDKNAAEVAKKRTQIAKAVNEALLNGRML